MTETVAETSGRPGVQPRAEPSAQGGDRFVDAAGLVVDEASGQKVVAHIDVGPSHHTPWGIVHGGVYATAVESAASIGACLAVEDRELIAVGLTNTTHFLRSISRRPGAGGGGSPQPGEDPTAVAGGHHRWIGEVDRPR